MYAFRTSVIGSRIELEVDEVESPGKTYHEPAVVTPSDPAGKTIGKAGAPLRCRASIEPIRIQSQVGCNSRRGIAHDLR